MTNILIHPVTYEPMQSELFAKPHTLLSGSGVGIFGFALSVEEGLEILEEQHPEQLQLREDIRAADRVFNTRITDWVS